MRVSLRSRQGGRRVDLALGLLLAAGVLTGTAANTIGADWPLDLIQLHAGAALSILLLAPWKYVVIRRGLRRTRRRRATKALSLTLAVFALVTIVSGLLHSTASSGSTRRGGACGWAGPRSIWRPCGRCRTSASPRSSTAPAAGTAARTGTASG